MVKGKSVYEMGRGKESASSWVRSKTVGTSEPSRVARNRVSCNLLGLSIIACRRNPVSYLLDQQLLVTTPHLHREMLLASDRLA